MKIGGKLTKKKTNTLRVAIESTATIGLRSKTNIDGWYHLADVVESHNKYEDFLQK